MARDEKQAGMAQFAKREETRPASRGGDRGGERDDLKATPNGRRTARALRSNSRPDLKQNRSRDTDLSSLGNTSTTVSAKQLHPGNPQPSQHAPPSGQGRSDIPLDAQDNQQDYADDGMPEDPYANGQNHHQHAHLPHVKGDSYPDTTSGAPSAVDQIDPAFSTQPPAGHTMAGYLPTRGAGTRVPLQAQNAAPASQQMTTQSNQIMQDVGMLPGGDELLTLPAAFAYAPAPNRGGFTVNRSTVPQQHSMGPPPAPVKAAAEPTPTQHAPVQPPGRPAQQEKPPRARESTRQPIEQQQTQPPAKLKINRHGEQMTQDPQRLQQQQQPPTQPEQHRNTSHAARGDQVKRSSPHLQPSRQEQQHDQPRLVNERTSRSPHRRQQEHHQNKTQSDRDVQRAQANQQLQQMQHQEVHRDDPYSAGSVPPSDLDNHGYQESYRGSPAYEQPPMETAVELDYDENELFHMSFDDLQRATFDEDPNEDPFRLPDEQRADSLHEKLVTVSSMPDQKKVRFFASLNIEEWEDAGSWFIEQFGEAFNSYKAARQEKRKIAKEFEAEVQKRHEAVSTKRKLTEDALSEMKESGGKVLQVTPQKKRKSR